jgi:CelD/BcsL family acetyltransferase involved in cellulose biosynthesis
MAAIEGSKRSPGVPRDPAGDGLVRVPLDDPRWLELARSCTQATPFHHPAWAMLLARTYAYPAFGLVIEDEDGSPVAGIPVMAVRTLLGRRRWMSLPYTDECPPLAVDTAAERRLIASLAGAHETLGAPRIEVRGVVDAVGWRARADAVVQVLDLSSDLDEVRGRFSRSQVVRNIARAEREGVQVRRASTADDVETFYQLHLRTRRRQGVPIQPRRFFELLRTDVLEAGLGSILLASAGGSTVAGALFLSWNGTTIYKFGASDPEGWPARPNHLLFWTAIQDSWARGDRRFDFGRTDVDNAGLRAFKRGWGAVERPLVYSTLDPSPGEPDGLLARAMRFSIQRGPAWVCRAIGERLYRYAGAR